MSSSCQFGTKSNRSSPVIEIGGIFGSSESLYIIGLFPFLLPGNFMVPFDPWIDSDPWIRSYN